MHGVSLIDITTVSTDGGYQAQLDRAAQWNVNVVRMPVYADNQLHGDTKPLPGGWTVAKADTLVTTYLDPAIQYAKSKGMYVIVDLHYITDVSAGDQYDTMAKAFWSDMAPRWADDPKVLYEVFNEPINTGGSQDWNAWKPLAQGYVDIIRASAPKNLVLVGAPHWDQLMGGCNDNPITGGNVVYVGHIYGWHYDGTEGTTFDSSVLDCHATYPMMLTEWGADTWSIGHADHIKSLIKDNGLSFTAWAFHNAWGPAMFSGGTDNVPSTWNVTPYGTFVQNLLAEY